SHPVRQRHRTRMWHPAEPSFIAHQPRNTMNGAGIVQDPIVLLDAVDFFRLDANRRLGSERRSELGQFMTPPPTARLMASMFAANPQHLSLLDAGAGVGSLTAAFVNEVCERRGKVSSLHVTAYEIDGTLSEYLASTLQQCGELCHNSSIRFTFDLIQSDFIEESTRSLRHEMFAPVKRFNCAILNPPYRKINSDSETRVALREVGIETSNL
ncbi:MAG: hypothetical protein WBM04_08655, partial [Candidatus Korobacteraceae bacterium]